MQISVTPLRCPELIRSDLGLHFTPDEVVAWTSYAPAGTLIESAP
jgi:hypothetical protein